MTVHVKEQKLHSTQHHRINMARTAWSSSCGVNFFAVKGAELVGLTNGETSDEEEDVGEGPIVGQLTSEPCQI